MILWSCNELIDDDIINSTILKLKNHPLCYEKKSNFYSSYFTPPNERPEKGLKKFYNSIINEASKDLTLYNRFEFDNHFWMQLYTMNGGTLTEHHHYQPTVIFSWVHFIRPTQTKCFHFLNHKNEKIYPDHQDKGDFILFPSYLLHAVDMNTSENDRVIIAGNVTVKKLTDKFSKGFGK